MTQRSASEMAAFEAYRAACLDCVASWAERVGPDAAAWSIHLIDHSEAPIGLSSLAWAIDEAGLVATPDEVRVLRDLIDGMEPEDRLPAQFQRID